MAPFKEPTLEERRAMAAKAKQAQLERARLKSPAKDPGFAARQAARVETAKAREVRTAERAAAKKASAEREAAERVVREREAAERAK